MGNNRIAMRLLIDLSWRISMTAYKRYVTIKDPKSLVLTGLPFKQGQVVEVVVIAQDNGESEERVRDLQALLKET
jgi:hypothetical protein